MNDEQQAKLRAKFRGLGALPENWDGYGAKRMDQHVADRLMLYCHQWITPSILAPAFATRMVQIFIKKTAIRKTAWKVTDER